MDVAGLPVLLATILMAAVDLLWNRLEWRRRLRMSVQDIKDAHKQIEGDPNVKAKLRGGLARRG